jgi:hypothetical protein
MCNINILFIAFAMLLLGQPRSFPATVLLIPLDAPNDKDTEDFKTAFPLTTRENGVVFDLDGDGSLEQVAWTQPNAATAFLAIDKNQNGVIDNGLELVGNRVLEGAANAIQALSKMPQSQDDAQQGGLAFINDQDPVYEKLLLWTDTNHNGISEESELRKASEVLTRIGLGYAAFHLTDDYGNLFRFQGWAEMRTAPGPNRAEVPDEHFKRTRRIYEVVLGTR